MDLFKPRQRPPSKTTFGISLYPDELKRLESLAYRLRKSRVELAREFIVAKLDEQREVDRQKRQQYKARKAGKEVKNAASEIKSTDQERNDSGISDS